jgi:hypothetical protein
MVNPVSCRQRGRDRIAALADYDQWQPSHQTINRSPLLVERQTRELSVQLTRIGQLQADIDLIRAAWAKVAPRTPAG